MEPTQAWPADRVERWPIDRLVPYARNARTHSPAQVEQLATSMLEWGWTNPVLVAEDGAIIAGHGRVLAAAKLGYGEVPVMVARGWTEAQIAAYRVADNKLALNAGWDEHLLRIELADLDGMAALAGFTAMELEQLFAPNTDPVAEWRGMPEFDQQDQSAYRSLVVHFADEAALEAFARLIDQRIGEKVRFIWYPQAAIGHYADKQYSAAAVSDLPAVEGSA